ncbi:transposase [Streptomyces maremycinicus]|uniref:transposase n=1 Tax=Streptomyces maremycinicus TaxID=1679753 RepID=UPI0035B54189
MEPEGSLRGHDLPDKGIHPVGLGAVGPVGLGAVGEEQGTPVGDVEVLVSAPGRCCRSVPIEPEWVIRVGGQNLGVNHETLGTWVRDAEWAARLGAVEATAMEKGNRQLRARVKELELEREILWRAEAGRGIRQRP